MIREGLPRSAVRLLALTVLASCAGHGSPTPKLPTGAPLRPGDLVFLDLDCGPTCEAVERVTADQFGVKGPALSHVAMVVEGGARPRVIEAWPGEGVVERSLQDLLARVRAGEGQPHGFWVARLRGGQRALGEAAAAAARRWLGRPYDDLFLPDQGRLYCAELILLAYQVAARAVAAPFKWLPMRFGRSGTPERAVWERYYRALGHEVPEGLPGVSPLGIFLQARPLFETTTPGVRP